MIGSPVLIPLMAQANNSPVGSIVESMLTESRFHEINGKTWVLSDGRSIVGTQYATVTGLTTAPDLRGQFARAKNNGRVDGNEDPVGERTLGAFQADAFEDHFHDVDSGGGNGSFSSGSLFMSTPNSGSNNIITQAAAASAGVADPKAYANETRIKNVAVNFFLKVDP